MSPNTTLTAVIRFDTHNNGVRTFRVPNTRADLEEQTARDAARFIVDSRAFPEQPGSGVPIRIREAFVERVTERVIF